MSDGVISDLAKTLSGTLILGVLGIVAVFLLLVPLVLRVAGLTGQQIMDTFNLTFQFAINLVREFRQQNKGAG